MTVIVETVSKDTLYSSLGEYRDSLLAAWMAFELNKPDEARDIIERIVTNNGLNWAVKGVFATEPCRHEGEPAAPQNEFD